MRRMKINAALNIATIAVSFALTGCTAEQLRSVNQQIANLNRTLSGPIMPQPTAAQQQQIISAINQPQSNQKIQQAISEAEPVIQKFIQFLACYSTDHNPSRYLIQYSAPNASFSSLVTPFSGMQYAPRNMCLDVVRMDNWNMPALNALEFRTIFQSSVSGESSSRTFTFQKQPNGEWLFLKSNL